MGIAQKEKRRKNMKLKKVLAVLMASAMIMGMSVTTFAADKTPNEDDKTTVAVSNVDVGSTVTAYQIVEADYNQYGFIGYKSVETGADRLPLVLDAEKPTSFEVGQIASKIDSGEITGLAQVSLSDEDGDGTYTGQLNPGYWVVLVRPGNANGVKVYNPMLLGVYYNESGSKNGMETDATEDNPLSANDKWTLEADEAWAKSSEVPFEKTADSQSENLGGEVNYDIKTIVPVYGPEYDNVKFQIKDTLSYLELKDEDGNLQIKVSADGTLWDDLGKENYTVVYESKGKEAFYIDFNSDWIKANGGKHIKVTYTAIVTDEAFVNEDSHDNNAEVIYTNNPEGTTSGNTDIEKVYTFDIDGSTTGNILKKVKPGETEGEPTALEGAEFTLYTDVACTQQYTNTAHPANQPTAISDKDGKLHITGLAEGTYYLKETKAPNEFTLNDTVFKIEIKAEYDEEELKSWDIIVTDTVTNEKVNNGFTVNNGDAIEDSDNELTEIMNTKLSSLPSTGGIGTTIFTIGGCVIMVTAAGLYFASRRKQDNK